MKILKIYGYQIYKPKEFKKEHKVESKECVAETGADERKQKEEDPLVPLVAHVIKILHSVFPNVEVYINNQQIYDSNRLFAHKSCFSKNFMRFISE